MNRVQIEILSGFLFLLPLLTSYLFNLERKNNGSQSRAKDHKVLKLQSHPSRISQILLEIIVVEGEKKMNHLEF